MPLDQTHAYGLGLAVIEMSTDDEPMLKDGALLVERDAEGRNLLDQPTLTAEDAEVLRAFVTYYMDNETEAVGEAESNAYDRLCNLASLASGGD